MINHSTFDRKVLETLDNISVKKRKNIQLKKQYKDKLPSKEEKPGFFKKLFRHDSTTELEKQIEDNELEIKMLKKSHDELFVGKWT